ncbi:transcriptional regulator GlxA family with amidase domain [Variovorax boronicumulans]|uniref:GlxA family transcriptional regulator n=1 Tax=Variovorax boronicumulans TaxID=436515 RepID=UPI002780DAC0|nr:GlxA family transcriptional regulator [Variovorax boronicumulans]MDP9912281.1 transcriptional regulator GlxA family with amidase domain [Variovorax boronicumulans]
MPSPFTSRARRVDIVVYPGFKALEAVGTMSVFEYANIHLVRQGQPRGYEIEIASTSTGPVPSDMLMSLVATRAIDEADLPDIAVIVGAREIEAALERNPSLVRWARAVAPHIDRLVALCSGSFFLAAADLLDGRRATTHWSVATLLQTSFPKVQVEADAIYLRAGRLWTSAGVTAGIDLALALVEEDFGRGLALEVARDLVVYLKRPGGQSQFSVHLASQNTSHPGIRAVQDWILAHLDEPLALSDMAERAAMSERNFRRVFGREVGESPLGFVERARLEAARRLLEDGDLPLKSIAGRIGFGSEQPMRKLFVKHLGITPHEYRARFGGSGHPVA